MLHLVLQRRWYFTSPLGAWGGKKILNHPPTPAPTLFRFYFARPPRAETGFEKKVLNRPGRFGIY